MGMTTAKYLKIQAEQLEIIAGAEGAIDEARAHLREWPKWVRPATPEDVVEDAIFWYLHEDGAYYWKQIMQVDYPDDEFKAYTAVDGCRYGLRHAYIACSAGVAVPFPEGTTPPSCYAYDDDEEGGDV